jgi:collagen type I/II/III/V/XI/XXIV/XXVII alpha
MIPSPFSSSSRGRGATVAGVVSVALSCVLLLCGAGSVPVENFLPQGAMQGDLNAGGHSVTNAATVSANNVTVSGTLAAPSSFTLPYGQITGTPTLGTLAGVSPSGTPSATTFVAFDGTHFVYATPPTDTGPAGAAGAAGAAGTNGTNGTDGTNGTTGAEGPQGIAGANGATGAPGIAGSNGTNGATGAQGPQGTAGTNGTNGATGTPGIAGTNGTNGATGAQGPQGTAGTNGTNGATGAQGPSGVAAATKPIYYNSGTQTVSETPVTGIVYGNGSGADNTAATQAQLAGVLASYYLTPSGVAAIYAPLASPALTGTPTAPTATAGTSTTQIATTAFANTAVSNFALSSQSLPNSATTVTVIGNAILVPGATPTAAQVVTLPAAASVAAGKPMYIVDTGGVMPGASGTGNAEGFTLTPAGSDTINGTTSYYFGPGQYTYALLMSNGSNGWAVMTPNSIRATEGGVTQERGTIAAPKDPTSNFGWNDNATAGGATLVFDFSGISKGSISSSGLNMPVSDNAYNYSLAYPNGGYGGNTMPLTFSGGGSYIGMNFSYGDYYGRILQRGYSVFSWSAPSTLTANTTAYVGDATTTGATTSFGVGKIPSIVGLDVTGGIQGDTSLVLTGTSAYATIPGTLTVGGGSTLKKFLSATASLSYGSIAGSSASTQTITVTGAGTNDSISLGWSAALPTGILVGQAWVSATNTVSVTLVNMNSASTSVPAITCRATDQQF